MRVLQRLAGRENPLTTLKVYEHTLHFRGGVAEIAELSEREIHRLRAFGFRVERDTGPKPKPTPTPEAAAGPAGAARIHAPEADPASSALPKRSHKKKVEQPEEA